MRGFVPDYQNLIDAAGRKRPKRVPLYEHIISVKVMEEILGVRFADLQHGDQEDRREFFRHYCQFFEKMGYDTVSFEQCIGGVLPGSGALGGHKPGVIQNREDFNRYPWDSVPDAFFERFAVDFTLLGETMPAGMKAVGGPGNGVFECVQDLVGFSHLCLLQVDDPELYKALFAKVGDVMAAIWERFLREFGHIYAVCRFGDDLGFKSATMLSTDHVKQLIIPEYARVVELVHRAGKKFLLHSCGNIFEVMDAIIEVGQVDAKHSNEDVIAPFPVWLEKYGDRIALFGGVDVDVLCQEDEAGIKQYVHELFAHMRPGCALGSGNSIPDFVPASGYLAMIEAVREERGEKPA